MTKDTKAEPKERKELNVYQAIAAVQAGLSKEGISKDQTATGGGGSSYKFRGIDDIYNALASLLADSGLCIIPRVLAREVVERKSSKGNALFYVVVDVEYDFVSSWDGSKHTARVCGEAMDSGDKATNKAMSAAYKYACLQTFCIPTEGDNDSENATHEVAPSEAPAYRPSDPQRPHKDKYVIAAPVKPDGTLDFDEFTAGLENALDSAANVNEVGLLNRSNAKTLRAMQIERPELFSAIGEKFRQMSQALA